MPQWEKGRRWEKDGNQEEEGKQQSFGGSVITADNLGILQSIVRIKTKEKEKGMANGRAEDEKAKGRAGTSR